MADKGLCFFNNCPHHTDGFDRVESHSRFFGKHHGIRSVEDGVGDIAYFGPSWFGLKSHTGEHLRRCDNRFFRSIALVNNLFLNQWQTRQRRFDTQIAARDHNHIDIFDNFTQVLERQLALNLGHRSRAAGDNIFDFRYVFLARHKTQTNQIQFLLQDILQILSVFVSKRIIKFDAW